MEMNRDNLSMAGEYAVASEVCRHDFYAQITLGHLKRTDILVYNPENQKEAKIEVKAKQERTWPHVKGISGDTTLLIFVDFKGKDEYERPDFYILTGKDWQDYLDQNVRGADDLKELMNDTTPVWNDGTVGQGVEVKEVLVHKERWEKLGALLS